MIIDHSGAPTARQVRTWPRRDLGLRHIPFFSYEHLRHPTVHDTERPSNLQAIRYPLARVRLSLCTYCVLRWTRRLADMRTPRGKEGFGHAFEHWI